MRNAVIHRARQLRVWLPRPAPALRPEQQLLVPTRTPAHRLARYELHLRHSPWLADLDALSSAESIAENWLPEPATKTVEGILKRVLGLAEAVLGPLAATWREAGEGEVVLPAPEEHWALGEPRGRARDAAGFAGFDADYRVPPLNSIVANPRDAKRAEIAEALRREGLELNEVEAQ